MRLAKVSFSRMRTVEFDLWFRNREPSPEEFQQACSHAIDRYERTGSTNGGCFYLWGCRNGLDAGMGFSYVATVVDSTWSKSHAPHHVDCDNHFVDVNKYGGRERMLEGDEFEDDRHAGPCRDAYQAIRGAIGSNAIHLNRHYDPSMPAWIPTDEEAADIEAGNKILIDLIKWVPPLAAQRQPVAPPANRSADPRLTHLPDDLRAVAVEFLDLHEAWGTEFEASIDARDEVTLRWSDYTDKRGVTEYAQADIHKAKGFRLTWGRNGFDGFIGKIEAKDSPLRRSADFAEFVQRFRLGGEG